MPISEVSFINKLFSNPLNFDKKLIRAGSKVNKVNFSKIIIYATRE